MFRHLMQGVSPKRRANASCSADRLNTPSIEDRFAGCLIGLALGDALGFLVEGHPGDHCFAFVRDVVRPGRLPTQRRDSFGFGQYSDDTQLVWCPRNNWRFGFLGGPWRGTTGLDLLQSLAAS